ncbi:MAG: DUF3883 domain-containing protein [Anaerovoracaceae bacterium]
MNLTDLRLAQTEYVLRMNEILNRRKVLYEKREDFIKYFTLSHIENMSIREYALGVDRSGPNFCYGLERELDGLGRTLGATAAKFGVYYSRKRGEFSFAKKYGDNYKSAYNNIKKQILSLLNAGERGNIEAIVDNKLSHMFKGKILSTYYPDKYLNVFSPKHLDYFLIQLDIDTPILLNGDSVYKREALILFKNNDIVMKDWTLDLFAEFLYREYPKGPLSDTREIPLELRPYVRPNFPKNYSYEFVYPTILDKHTIFTSKKHSKKKRDYDADAHHKRILGERGEKIVLEAEFNRLQKLEAINLANRIKQVSKESDSFGYDILSYNEDGSERYIEVKATSSPVGEFSFYYTANELNTAIKYQEQYYVYIVFGVTTETPKIWIMPNPFVPKNELMEMIPVNYKININVK